jgi:hypothetical protein
MSRIHNAHHYRRAECCCSAISRKNWFRSIEGGNSGTGAAGSIPIADQLLGSDDHDSHSRLAEVGGGVAPGLPLAIGGCRRRSQSVVCHARCRGHRFFSAADREAPRLRCWVSRRVEAARHDVEVKRSCAAILAQVAASLSSYDPTSAADARLLAFCRMQVMVKRKIVAAAAGPVRMRLSRDDFQ